MASESKVQKVARQATMRQSIGTCKCGGELIWARVILNRPRTMKVCEKCGVVFDNELKPPPTLGLGLGKNSGSLLR